LHALVGLCGIEDAFLSTAISGAPLWLSR